MADPAGWLYGTHPKGPNPHLPPKSTFSLDITHVSLTIQNVRLLLTLLWKTSRLWSNRYILALVGMPFAPPPPVENALVRHH